jgi:hypothetical protein
LREITVRPARNMVARLFAIEASSSLVVAALAPIIMTPALQSPMQSATAKTLKIFSDMLSFL